MRLVNEDFIFKEWNKSFHGVGNSINPIVRNVDFVLDYPMVDDDLLVDDVNGWICEEFTRFGRGMKERIHWFIILAWKERIDSKDWRGFIKCRKSSKEQDLWRDYYVMCGRLNRIVCEYFERYG